MLMAMRLLAGAKLMCLRKVCSLFSCLPNGDDSDVVISFGYASLEFVLVGIVSTDVQRDWNVIQNCGNMMFNAI